MILQNDKMGGWVYPGPTGVGKTKVAEDIAVKIEIFVRDDELGDEEGKKKKSDDDDDDIDDQMVTIVNMDALQVRGTADRDRASFGRGKGGEEDEREVVHELFRGGIEEEEETRTKKKTKTKKKDAVVSCIVFRNRGEDLDEEEWKEERRRMRRRDAVLRESGHVEDFFT